MITRHEIEVARSMREHGRKAIVDIYIAWAIDGAPIENGADIRYVVEELRSMNATVLKTELGWVTPLCLRNHFELSRKLFTLHMSEIAANAEWHRIPGEIWRGARSMVNLAILYVRRCLLPGTFVLTPEELRRLHA